MKPSQFGVAIGNNINNKGDHDMIQFLIHEKTDTMGVATVDIKVQGLYMDCQEPTEIKAPQDIPLGHKIALKDFKIGEGALKYGQDIGKIVADIRKGEHVHIHNLKTRRW
jgi:(2R)-sulfolactate sulfo-lyase subunit alpha